MLRQLRDGEASGVVVELDTAIIDEARQTLPARERVADGVGKLALLTDQTELCAQPLILKSCNFPRRKRNGSPPISVARRRLRPFALEIPNCRAARASASIPRLHPKTKPLTDHP